VCVCVCVQGNHLSDDDVYRTTHVDVDEIYLAIFLNDFGGFGQVVGMSAADLNAEKIFAFVSSEQRPFRPLTLGQDQTKQNRCELGRRSENAGTLAKESTGMQA
jgi:hypothetical protein